MTVIAASTTTALVFGSPAAATAAFWVSVAQGAAGLGIAAAGPSAAMATAGASAALVNGAAAGAAAAASGLATVTGAASMAGGSLVAAAVTGGASVLNVIGGGMISTLVEGGITGAIAAISSTAASAGGFTGVATASVFAGPIGLAVVGADEVTWDCWKPVVMESSVEPSRGLTLRDLYNHPNVRQIIVNNGNMVVENVKGEQYRLVPLPVPVGWSSRLSRNPDLIVIQLLDL